MVCFFSTLLINFVGTSHVITGYDRFLAGRSVKLLHTKDGGGGQASSSLAYPFLCILFISSSIRVQHDGSR